MNNHRTLLLLLLIVPLGVFAEGSIGMSASVSVDGIFSPEIVEFKIDDVQAGSPADKAGVKVGQLVIELDGCEIPGCKASKAKKLMNKEAGELLPLLVRKVDGSEVLLTINVGQKVQR